jgi:hypothetical protein
MAPSGSYQSSSECELDHRRPQAKPSLKGALTPIAHPACRIGRAKPPDYNAHVLPDPHSGAYSSWMSSSSFSLNAALSRFSVLEHHEASHDGGSR